MAFALGFAGGFADEQVVEPPVVPPVTGGPLWIPDRPTTRTKGRATIRLKVTVAAWGSDGRQRSRRTIAAATRTSGRGVARSSTTVTGDVEARYGHAAATARTKVLTHVGDPREDDQIILLAVAALCSSSTARAPDHHGSKR